VQLIRAFWIFFPEGIRDFNCVEDCSHHQKLLFYHQILACSKQDEVKGGTQKTTAVRSLKIPLKLYV
jgi:hypothetical protein